MGKNDKKIHTDFGCVVVLDDNGTAVHVSVGTLIECLQVADQVGEIPPLPNSWKSQIPDDIRVEVEENEG